jgi:hypothetical protein
MKIRAILTLFALSALCASAQTYTVSVLYTFPGSSTGPNTTGPSGIAVDSKGNIYAAGNFSISPNGPGVAQIFAPTTSGGNGSAVLIAGGNLSGFMDGTGSAAEFGIPEGMATDAAGNIYLADEMGHQSATIRKIAPATGAVTTLSGLSGTTQEFGNANGVAVSSSGAIYVSAAGGPAGDLSQYVPGGAPITIPVGPIIDAQAGGQQIEANYGAFGITVDSANSLYVAVYGNGPLVNGPAGAYNAPAQLYVATVANGSSTQLFSLPLGSNSQLERGSLGQHGPENADIIPITIDNSGNIYVGWFGNLYLYNGGTGPAQIASLGGEIVGLATDSVGRVYVAVEPPGYGNIGNNNVQVNEGVGQGEIVVVAPPGVAPLPSTPTPPPPASALPTQFINISTRANVGTGSSIAIAGFVISGSANEEVLIRGIGPTLAQFLQGGVLAQPVLTLFNSAGTQVATNTGWGTNTNVSQISAAFTATGAFPLPSGSADSALLLSLAPGSYTAEVSGLNNTTGIALVEVYEVPTGTP